MDPSIGAYLSRDLPAALQLAARADLNLPLGGVPIAIKDNINVAGQPCTCASRILQNYRAPYDATVIRKLIAAGAIPFGKTNLDEFAMGSSTENSCVRTTLNPWDRSRVAGGSSGGSAAAVASGQACAALGSDTGGSVRQPAGFCGVVGVKPTYGRVSRFGLVAFASSFDQIGPITRNVRDAALLLNAIAGHDPQDSTSLEDAVPDFTARLGHDLRGVRLGVVKEFSSHGIAPAVTAAVQAAVEQCASLGAEIVEVSLPHTDYAVAVYYILATAEASANLARFDGVRYGHRAAKPQSLLDHYERTRAEGFGAEVKRRIILGTYALSSGYYDAYYLRAQKVRELIRRDFAAAFSKSGRAHLAHCAHARVQNRRASGRSAANVSGRYFHHLRQPHRDLRAQSALRIFRRGRRRAFADRVAINRPPAGGSATAPDRPRLRAEHRLASAASPRVAGDRAEPNGRGEPAERGAIVGEAVCFPSF